MYVGGGMFTMGNNKGDVNEKPEHKVRINEFYLLKYEVTIADFRRFIQATNYITDAERDGWSWVWSGDFDDPTGQIIQKPAVSWECDELGRKRSSKKDHYPVIHVSWNDAFAFCSWFSKETGNTYRLPTEAEWEYAAKGGPNLQDYAYSGDNELDKVAWYRDNCREKMHMVGQRKPNSLGIYDTTGNAMEWCLDWYDPAYYAKSPADNPTGPNAGTLRVLRGGSWMAFPARCENSNRNSGAPTRRNEIHGFRILREISR